MNLKFVICNSLIVLLLMSPFLVYCDERLNLAVADFEARNVSVLDAITISDLLRTELIRLGTFRVVDRKNMDTILTERRFQISGCNNQVCAVEIGKLLNVDKIVIGAYNDLFGAYYINISLVDIGTAEILYADAARIRSYLEIEKVIKSLAVRLALKFGVRGIDEEEKIELRFGGIPCISRVIKGGNTVKINRGTYDGVKQNDLFSLYHGETIIGQLKVNVVKDDESIAEVARLEKNYRIVPGMILKYTGRIRKHGLGFMLGINRGGTFSRNGPGIGFCYDFISESGLGFQLSVAIWGNGESRDNPSGTSTEESISVNYLYPLFLRLYREISSPVSPFIGVGVSYARFEWRYWPRIGPRQDDSSNSFVPVLNAGLKFFAANPSQFTLDWRYFLGGEYHGWETNLYSIMGCISTYW